MVIKAEVALVTGPSDSRYAVTWPVLDDQAVELGIDEGDSVTFSISNWQGDGEPERRQMVELGNIMLFAGGLRAGFAKPIEIRNRKGEQCQTR